MKITEAIKHLLLLVATAAWVFLFIVIILQGDILF